MKPHHGCAHSSTLWSMKLSGYEVHSCQTESLSSEFSDVALSWWAHSQNESSGGNREGAK